MLTDSHGAMCMIMGYSLGGQSHAQKGQGNSGIFVQYDMFLHPLGCQSASMLRLQACI